MCIHHFTENLSNENPFHKIVYILPAVWWLGCIAGPIGTFIMCHFVALCAISAWIMAFQKSLLVVSLICYATLIVIEISLKDIAMFLCYVFLLHTWPSSHLNSCGMELFLLWWTGRNITWFFIKLSSFVQMVWHLFRLISWFPSNILQYQRSMQSENTNRFAY